MQGKMTISGDCQHSRPYVTDQSHQGVHEPHNHQEVFSITDCIRKPKTQNNEYQPPTRLTDQFSLTFLHELDKIFIYHF